MLFSVIRKNLRSPFVQKMNYNERSLRVLLKNETIALINMLS